MKIPEFNSTNMYETRVYTDIVLGSINHNVPIIPSTIPGMISMQDPLRTEMFIGSTVIHTTNGPINIDFPIDALSLSDAATKFNAALQDALKEMQSRQLRSKIITGGGGPSESRLNNKN